MNEKTYILSPLFSLPEENEVIDTNSEDFVMTEELNKVLNKELFFLSNDKKDQLFLINPTIRQFLLSFCNPKSCKAVINEFAQSVKCRSEQIFQAMNEFFEDMQHRGVLVDIEMAEKLKAMEESLPEEKSLYTAGDRLDRYEVIAEISMRKRTELYLVKDARSGDQLAIKIARINPTIEEQYIPNINRNFGQEFLLMRELGFHPNICTLLDYNDSNPRRPYAVMEYIDGISLKKYLRTTSHNLAAKLNLIEQVLMALSYVQSKHILHGDIHASNFMVTKDQLVKLIDFDLANHELPQENEILKNGAVYNYIPPERLKVNAFNFLKRRANLRSEVFQAGLILYLIIYGQLPFRGFTWKKLAMNIQQQQPTLALQTLQQETIPEYVIELISKCLEKEPTDRFDSIDKALDFFISNR